MSMITVYSKCTNSVELPIYKTESFVASNGDKKTQSSKLKSVVILGVNAYKKEKFKNIFVNCDIAETQVDKTLWDELCAVHGATHPMFKKGQIFTAKSFEEARLKAMDAPAFIADLYTAEKHKSKRPVAESLI
jgi:hypothetical protein